MSRLEPPDGGSTAKGFIEGAAGAIECQLSAPKDKALGVAVICHPHPLYGGAMSNKIVYTLDGAARQFGLVSLRFNFRGVGRSAGTHDHAMGETDDCVQLGQWLRDRYPDLPLLQAGFSFGGYVSLHAATRLKPTAMITVAPPLDGYIDAMGQPPHPGCPWLTIHSRDDDVVSFDQMRKAAEIYKPAPQWIEVDNAGHFFHGRLGDIKGAAERFLEEHWPLP